MKKNKTEKSDKKLTPEKTFNILNFCYDKALSGIPKTKNCYELADEYLNKYNDREKAAKEFMKWQVAKCATTGFIAGFGGGFTMVVSIPADLATVWYIQLRMLAVMAIIGGLDPTDDYVRTLAYICIAGSSVSQALKEAGVKIANKVAMAGVKRIPGKVLIAINKKVGFRLFTKLGEKGAINLVKLVPVVGAVAGGGMDLVETKMIASKAYKTFILNDFE